MKFQIKEPQCTGKQLRQIIINCLADASAQLCDQHTNVHARIHDTRKRFKEIRSVLLLVRPALGQSYQKESQWITTTARQLASLRDAKAMLEACDSIKKYFPRPAEQEILSELSLELENDLDLALARQPELDRELAKIGKVVRNSRSRIMSLTFESDDFELVRPGYQQCYRRGRSLYHTCLSSHLKASHTKASHLKGRRKIISQEAVDPGETALKAAEVAINHAPLKTGSSSQADFHRWRKWVKVHGCHTQLLNNAWPAELKGREEALKQLGIILGDDHDLLVLGKLTKDRYNTSKAKATPGYKKEVKTLIKLFGKRRRQLQTEALSLGGRLYAEKPNAHLARIEAYWQSWREDSGQMH